MITRDRRRSFAGVRGRPTPLFVFGAMLSASLAFRCAGKSESDGGSTNGGSSARSGNGSGGAAGSGTGGVINTGGSTGGTTVSTPCNADGDCPLPPSVCQDGSSIGYYTDPHCTAGQCTYTLQVYRCPSSCASGACTASTTTTSIGPPPPDPRCVATDGSSSTGGQSSGASPIPGGAGGATGARIIIGGASGFGPTGGFSGAITTGGAGGIATGGDGGVGAMGGSSGCDLPASVCGDATTLVYYTEPRCENLQCVFTTNTLACAGGCSNGACQGGFTAPAPP
jgi:hypothetical protein